MIQRDRVRKRDREREFVTLGRCVGLGVEVEGDGARTDVGGRDADPAAAGVLIAASAARASGAGSGSTRDRRQRDVRSPYGNRGRERDTNGVIAVESNVAVVGAVVIGQRQSPAGLDRRSVSGDGTPRRTGLRVRVGVHHCAIVVARIRCTGSRTYRGSLRSARFASSDKSNEEGCQQGQNRLQTKSAGPPLFQH